MLIQQDDGLAKLPAHPDGGVHDSFCSLPFLAPSQKNVVGLFKDEGMLKRLSFSFLKPVVVNPQRQGIYQEGLVGIGEGIELDNHWLL